MTVLYDVINFNADASCLDSDDWLTALAGGEHSTLFKWLRLYIDLNKPVSLGFTGATLSDIWAYNPESILLLRQHDDIFQIIWRPFSHDLPFFRTDEGFLTNVALGRNVAEYLIGRCEPIFLPPEFMQTNRQTAILAEQDAQATFIMGQRFHETVALALPDQPYWLTGIPEGRLLCIPVVGELTNRYLSCIQLLDIFVWISALESYSHIVVWRDGESSFLIPNGLERERFWLNRCSAQRAHLRFIQNICNNNSLQGYPVHPFSSWMNEMSMLWFLNRLYELEKTVFQKPSPIRIARWLHCIGSDILSSIEKEPPVVQLKSLEDDSVVKFVISRANRGYEGEALLEAAEKQLDIRGNAAWQRKAQAREQLILELL